VRAPFEGVLTEVAVVPGRLIGANEKLGVLVDPEGLEVAFGVSNAEYVRLAAADGAMPAHPGAAGAARADRAGRCVGGRRAVGAHALCPARGGPLGTAAAGGFPDGAGARAAAARRGGDPGGGGEPGGAHPGAGEGERLEEVTVRILRRQGDRLIVAGAPFGREYVTERQPQLGPGVLVRPIRPEAAERAGTPRPRGG
jgi:hypothetical protein